MIDLIRNLTLIVVFAPLLGCLIAGLTGEKMPNKVAAWTTIVLVGISFLMSLIIIVLVVIDGLSFNGNIYTWARSGNFQFDVGFLVDNLTAVMMAIVTFVSFLVHIYSVGYMAGDPGYKRFFSYVSFFTFSMLILVSSNNFAQLFFGWEGVGLASYLLIGFWFKKESAAQGSLKAFLVNRAGDFGFILGIAAILDYLGSLDYQTVFKGVTALSNTTVHFVPHTHWSIITVIGILLFIGAMGKSAQIPLHIWLPESMEGPTPISALIHAATMVTAGVFMVARMSPIYEYSQTALSVILIIGATGGLFLGLLAFVENDIKRVIAFSTMSQLGYMMAANGVSAFSAGIFHLLTHACFKALLFLSAGSIIIALHHEQNLLKMGNLKKYLPITYVCFLIGALSLAAIPPFSGFYSKDAILAAVKHATIPGANYAYVCLLIGTFVTTYYIFRAFFMAFHGKENIDPELKSHIHEHWMMLVPMILLAIPSVVIGAILAKPMLYAIPQMLGKSIFVLPQYDVLSTLADDYHGAFSYALNALREPPLWFALCGLLLSWINYVIFPGLPAKLKQWFKLFYFILREKYGFDKLNELIFVHGARKLSHFLFYFADLKILDGFIVNGTGRGISRISSFIRRLQTGYLYQYALVMIIGLIVFLIWMMWWK